MSRVQQLFEDLADFEAYQGLKKKTLRSYFAKTGKENRDKWGTEEGNRKTRNRLRGSLRAHARLNTSYSPKKEEFEDLAIIIEGLDPDEYDLLMKLIQMDQASLTKREAIEKKQRSMSSQLYDNEAKLNRKKQTLLTAMKRRRKSDMRQSVQRRSDKPIRAPYSQ